MHGVCVFGEGRRRGTEMQVLGKNREAGTAFLNT